MVVLTDDIDSTPNASNTICSVLHNYDVPVSLTIRNFPYFFSFENFLKHDLG